MLFHSPGTELKHMCYLNEAKNQPQGVFACPGSKTTTTTDAFRKHYGINYRLTRMCASGNPGKTLDTTILKISNPSGRAMIFDINQNAAPSAMGAMTVSEAQNRAEMVNLNQMMRHQGANGANILFVDGHVESRAWNAIPPNRLDASSNNQGNFWCRVNQ